MFRYSLFPRRPSRSCGRLSKGQSCTRPRQQRLEIQSTVTTRHQCACCQIWDVTPLIRWLWRRAASYEDATLPVRRMCMRQVLDLLEQRQLYSIKIEHITNLIPPGMLQLPALQRFSIWHRQATPHTESSTPPQTPSIQTTLSPPLGATTEGHVSQRMTPVSSHSCPVARPMRLQLWPSQQQGEVCLGSAKLWKQVQIFQTHGSVLSFCNVAAEHLNVFQRSLLPRLCECEPGHPGYDQCHLVTGRWSSLLRRLTDLPTWPREMPHLGQPLPDGMHHLWHQLQRLPGGHQQHGAHLTVHLSRLFVQWALQRGDKSHGGGSKSNPQLCFFAGACCPTGVKLYRRTNNSLRVYWRSVGLQTQNHTVELYGTGANYTCIAAAGSTYCDIQEETCGDVYTVVVAPVEQSGLKVSFCQPRTYSGGSSVVHYIKMMHVYWYFYFYLSQFPVLEATQAWVSISSHNKIQ